jgi:hypothetical protein
MSFPLPRLSPLEQLKQSFHVEREAAFPMDWKSASSDVRELVRELIPDVSVCLCHVHSLSLSRSRTESQRTEMPMLEPKHNNKCCVEPPMSYFFCRVTTMPTTCPVCSPSVVRSGR